MSSYRPAVIPKSVPCGTVFKKEPKDSSTYENGGTNKFHVAKLSLFQEKPGSARYMPRHIPLNTVSRMHSQSHWTGMEDRTDLRHKLATQVKESTKMVNHSTQTFEDPFEKNSYFHWMEIDSQKVEVPKDFINELTLDMLRPAAAKHLPVSLMPESIRRVRNIIPPPRLPQTTSPAVEDDCPRYLLVDKDLCWRCGHLGHKRQSCRKPWKIFCSRCGRCGVRSADCSCGQCPGSVNNKSSRLRGPRRMFPTTPTGSSCYRQGNKLVVDGTEYSVSQLLETEKDEEDQQEATKSDSVPSTPPQPLLCEVFEDETAKVLEEIVKPNIGTPKSTGNLGNNRKQPQKQTTHQITEKVKTRSISDKEKKKPPY
ncbi:hypothetical protein JTB14_012421 [Gonioctena quinquepunctata]|nr:hypothetical protein JTB14_012421 [Gonioctena quinquepunctata]